MLTRLMSKRSFLVLAERAKAFLDAENILAFVLDSNLIGINQTLTWAAGGVRLQVPSSEAERAVDVLRNSGFIDQNDHLSFNTCPACGSRNIKHHGFTKLEMILSVLVLGALMLFLKREHTCVDCGHTWRA